MEIITKYRAADGTEFFTEIDCIAYENRQTDMVAAVKLLRNICMEISTYDDECKGCPFADGEHCKLSTAYPFEWNLED